MPPPARPPLREQQLHRLLEMLLAYPAVVLSGERLAHQLGVSRSTVWHGIGQLRGYGVSISGHPGTGYQLLAMPDLLAPALVGSALRTPHLAVRLHHFFSVDSTQSAALEAARRGAAEGELFVAETQTAGRGRQGHVWDSPLSAGIYASLVLRPPGTPAALLTLTLAAGLAVADAVREATGLEPEIRWPNDLLLDGKKFAGLLLEMSAEATRILYAVLGVGINVARRDWPGPLADEATSLAAHLRSRPSRIQLLAALVRCFEARYLDWQRDTGVGVPAEFERRSRYARDLPVRVDTGEDAFDGITAGLDPSGFLRVRLADGSLRTVLHGGVRERPAAHA